MNYEKFIQKPLRILPLSAIFILIFSFSVSAQAIVSISPSSQTKSLYSDSNVTVNVQISGVTDLCGFQFDLTYNSNILTVTSPGSVVEGTFLSISGSDPTDWTPPKLSPGLIYDAACVRLKESGVNYTGVNGNGVLATVAFGLNKGSTPPGRSYLNLTGVKLSDRNTNPISFTTTFGIVNTRECLNGETRSCLACGASGVRTCVNYVWGPCNATCPPEICDGIDNNQDGYIDNAPGVSTSYTLTRYCSINHTGICAVGNETCTPSRWAGCPQPRAELCNTLDEDCDGDNNECLGDITDSAGGGPDGCVNIYDLTLVSSKFGLISTDAGWDARTDLVIDYEVDIYDLVTVARDFGNGPSC